MSDFKRLTNLLQQLAYKHGMARVWSDFVFVDAVLLSVLDGEMQPERLKEREKVLARYDEKERQMLDEMVEEVAARLDESGDQDFLGEFYMRLNLGNDSGGQFFTPYPVSKLMATFNLGSLPESPRPVRVNDPCCGSGGMLIAAFNVIKDQGIDAQEEMLAVAQDIDQTVALMCFIQMSLLGIQGVVKIGNTLSPAGDKVPRENMWFTPNYVLHYAETKN